MSDELKPGGAQLRVSHPEEGNFVGRGIKLSLDGGDWVQLKAKRTLVREIDPGHHRLRADNTYHSKFVEFDVQVGEQVHYKITNRVGYFGAMMLTILGAGPMHLEIERVDQ